MEDFENKTTTTLGKEVHVHSLDETTIGGILDANLKPRIISIRRKKRKGKTPIFP
jgi:hypothetical protein